MLLCVACSRPAVAISCLLLLARAHLRNVRVAFSRSSALLVL